MKLAVSNIAFDNKDKDRIYSRMKKLGYIGIEVAPSIISGSNPYDDVVMSKEFQNKMKNEYGFEVCSMQSIWYGRKELLFGKEEERVFLLEYTKKAVDYAQRIGCRNLVFGCPRNRILNDESKIELALSFFKELGGYADERNVIIGIEANPRIYGTNFLNSTKEAIDFIEMADSRGIGLNFDLGTVIENGESFDIVRNHLELISHVHISEPHLVAIKEREMHQELFEILKSYDGYISIEMGNQCSEVELLDAIDYIARLNRNV